MSMHEALMLIAKRSMRISMRRYYTLGLVGTALQCAMLALAVAGWDVPAALLAAGSAFFYIRAGEAFQRHQDQRRYLGLLGSGSRWIRLDAKQSGDS